MTANPNMADTPSFKQTGGRRLRRDSELFQSRLGGNSTDLIRRLFCQLLGGACVMSALGLWFWPGSDWGPDVFAIKTGLTIFLVCSAGFLLAWRAESADLVEVDQKRREVRFVKRKGERMRTVRRIGFDNLTALYVEDDALHIVARGVYLHEVIELQPSFDRSILRRLA